MNDKSDWAALQTCVSEEGRFVFGLHAPHFRAVNLRSDDSILPLGKTDDGDIVNNRANFPTEDVEEKAAESIIEIANPFPFRGTTFIGKSWADRVAKDPGQIAIATPRKVSLGNAAKQSLGADPTAVENLFAHLPDPIKLAVASTSTDPEDLKLLAQSCCRMVFDKASGRPTGIVHDIDSKGRRTPCIFNHQLYDTVANNPNLADTYKEVMVLRPGIQGGSEIVGQWRRQQSHVFEYLRRNSYIPWGHYAANMAHDAVRYHVGNLSREDIFGMRHLYYQRTYVRLASALGLTVPAHRSTISPNALENLRGPISNKVKSAAELPFSATLWGWNYGYDYAPSGYRLHASHQQIHQQYALIPANVPLAGAEGGVKPAFACGDMVQSFVRQFKQTTGRPFFHSYEQAILANNRMDNESSKPWDLVVYKDDQVMLFTPKAQTSQWELQLMPRHAIGNILEADSAMRQSLDNALLIAMRVLAAMGASMITVIEYSKRFDSQDKDQRLLYSFLPRLPESPGAFSEAQLRWIIGHYPEDFAAACRLRLEEATKDLKISP